jgi:hypothetical protein
MSCTRRDWIHWLIGAVSFGAFSQRSARGVPGAGGERCTGIVSDPQGVGIPKLSVQGLGADGQSTNATTRGDGGYDLEAPAKGPYMVIFRELQGNTQLHEVRQLTGGTSQKLSVTVDPTQQKRSFSALYNMLQATESFCVSMWISGSRARKLDEGLLKMIPMRELRSNLEHVRGRIDAIEPTVDQRAFLTAKSDAIEKLLAALG